MKERWCAVAGGDVLAYYEIRNVGFDKFAIFSKPAKKKAKWEHNNILPDFDNYSKAVEYMDDRYERTRLGR